MVLKETLKKEKKGGGALWIVLHAMLAVYAMSSVSAKLASQEKALSFEFCMFYSISLMLLAIYAIGWQQIIKRMSLTAAYANKAVGVIWACIYGFIFFGEKITLGKVISGFLTIAGVVLFAIADSSDTQRRVQNNKDQSESSEKSVYDVNEIDFRNQMTSEINEMRVQAGETMQDV